MKYVSIRNAHSINGSLVMQFIRGGENSRVYWIIDVEGI